MKTKFAHFLLEVTLYLSLFALVKCNRWLTNLPDSRKINTLSFIGTHTSATHQLIFKPVAKTQDLTITQQLEAGIRVLDMRVRLNNDDFAMQYDRLFLGMMFGEVINQINAFLVSNPKEFVIMFMQEEWNRARTTMNECQILESKYINNYPNLFVKNWTVNDTIGKHRGKILLARSNRGFGNCTTDLSCDVQNNWQITWFYTKNNKWNDIKSLQDKMINMGKKNQCYINYLSGNGGPILISPMNICCAAQNPSMYLRGASLMSLGMNDRMFDYFQNPRDTLYIVMADFPSARLINKIVNSN